MSKPLSEADIIFPHLCNTSSLSSTLSSLRRSSLSTHNRLASILLDSVFVETVASAYELPLVANERCGSWYIPLSRKSGSVYFKSTDGHMGEWSFSLRRLNLQLLDVVAKWGGAVVVDSTRRGKSMPDALSKTIPIWCCVMNRALFGGERTGEAMELFTPPQAVGESEHAQMQKRIDGFVRQFLVRSILRYEHQVSLADTKEKNICKPNIPLLRSKLQKPLRPIWVTQQSSLPESSPKFSDFHPIVLCTASRRVRGAEASENGYIQGAADDHEAWSHGLTPPVFWKHKDLLMSTSEEDATDVISKLIKEQRSSCATASLIQPTSQLYISSSDNVQFSGFDVVVSCTPEPLAPSALKEAGVKHYLHLKCQSGKLGSRDLRTQLAHLPPFFASLPAPSAQGNMFLCCPTGKDLSVGVALAILCLYTTESGTIDTSRRKEAREMGKALIKQRLSWVTTSNAALNPSRATLQSVNAMLLSSSQDPKVQLQTQSPSTSITANLTILDSRTPEIARETPSHPTHPPDSPSFDPQLPRTMFQNFHNTASQAWTFSRDLSSMLSTHPSGRVTGTATFTPCDTSTEPCSDAPRMLLYGEQGTFVTTTGLQFSASRKYVYQLHGAGASADEEDVFIAVNFFDDEKMRLEARGETGVGAHGQGIGGLFVEMGKLEKDGEGVYRAGNRETHLCGEDLYAAQWAFGSGMAVQGQADTDVWWEVRYDVKGPQKDYVSTTRYTKM